jgi:uncharacterized membrane protein YphA (DoxX/SURF4 family)
MVQSARKRPSAGYIVVGVLMALMMFFSAAMKFTLNPGTVHVIHEVVGVPLNLLPALGACEVAGGLGLLAGIWRPGLGLAASIGLVVYFVGAHVAHILVADWAGLKAPLVPLVMSCTALLLSLKRTSSVG